MRLIPFATLLLCTTAGQAQSSTPEMRIRALETKLERLTRHLQEVTEEVAAISQDLRTLRQVDVTSPGRGITTSPLPSDPGRPFGEARSPLAEQIMSPDLGRDERLHDLKPQPEIFIQTRYSTFPLRDSGDAFDPNFSLTRIETRWAGRLTPRVGAGLELQFHPALDGSPEELVNDAFLEMYLSRHATLRAGQFIKPFGFDIQQSSAKRESPERGMFAGYFFPGQRDRGLSLFGDLGFIQDRFRNTKYALAAVNGNRFFRDSNRQVNYVVRLRTLFEEPSVAAGISFQRGRQVTPLAFTGTADEHLVGLDVQYVIGRLGIRAEAVRGDRPSTLLSIDPEFTPAFRSGAHSIGGHVFGRYQLNKKRSVYARYDHFAGDPVVGKTVRAFNIGYSHSLNRLSRLSIDYQFKNRASFNDDAVNGRLNVTWDVVIE